MTREGFSAHRLPPAQTLAQSVGLFRKQLAGAGAEAGRQAEELYQMLFGAIPKEVARKPRWRVVPDGALFDLPFAALAPRRNQEGPVYLVQDHSLLLMTTALNLESGASRAPLSGAMLAIADPVYNSADSRLAGARRTSRWLRLSSFSFFGPSPSEEGFQLPRLPASAAEAAACARLWRESGREVYILSGNHATAESVRQFLARRPAILHFATHLVPDPAAKDETQIALSLGPRGAPELLGSVDVRSWPLEGALVILSGCSSGAGRTLPGQGRSGLTRAWLSAGASAVVATYWPIPDGGGELLRCFYENLLHSNSKSTPADRALQSAQLAMIRSRPPHSDPSCWASYFVVGRKEW
jgi:CHAT domain-containing protein